MNDDMMCFAAVVALGYVMAVRLTSIACPKARALIASRLVSGSLFCAPSEVQWGEG